MTMGLSTGAFYALLSLGLAVIFGMLNVINFAHGAQFMMGAFLSWMLLSYAGIPFWAAIVLVPFIMAAFGFVLEKTLLSRLHGIDHLYGLLLTFGLALVMEGLFRHFYGVSGRPYDNPLPGFVDLGYMRLPLTRAFAILLSLIVCLATWYAIERTKLGSYLRAATERPDLVQAFGINVPLMISLTYAFGVALAGLAGVLAAPIYNVSPLMGSHLIIVVFAVVVIGGMGSIMGSILTGFGLGLVEGLTKVVYPPASNVVVFFVMVIVLMARPQGLFGSPK